jgi:hypothetical protein
MIELMLTIEPLPFLIICSAASLVPRKTLVWLTARRRLRDRMEQRPGARGRNGSHAALRSERHRVQQRRHSHVRG